MLQFMFTLDFNYWKFFFFEVTDWLLFSALILNKHDANQAEGSNQA